MSVAACAEIVRRGDPDRFLAVMAAPVAARQVLFPIYAFNVEVARAPWVTAEPLIAQMRLQWWRDALGEIAGGGVVRRHEVVVPLAHVLDGEAVRLLDGVVQARHGDIMSDPPDSFQALETYLCETGGNLMAAASHALGGDDPHLAARIGTAGAAANYLLAVPALMAAGRQPLMDRPLGTIQDLAGGQLDSLEHLERYRTHNPPAALRVAFLAAWRARGILEQARRDPAAVQDGRLGGSEFARRAGLLRASWFGI